MRASVYIATSLDGFIAREDGSLDWLMGSGDDTPADGLEDESASQGDHVADAAVADDYGYHAFMESVDALVMGRGTYDVVQGFDGEWPYGDKRVVVLSNTLKEIPEELATTVEVRSGTPAEIVQALEAEGIHHIYVDGGKTIQAFLNAGLIQELIITRIPILIGSGIPLFGPLEQDIKLEHIKTQTYPNGYVQHQYKVSA